MLLNYSRTTIYTDMHDELAWLSYDGLAGRYWQKLQGELGRALLDLQRRRRVIVYMEYEQPVFHITLWNPG